ncbi:MAG: glutathione S-transferase family protein [Polyangiaceae bacterium]
MKLYYSQFTRAGRARWMLEEVGASYELVKFAFAKGDHKTPEYLSIHPHGVVPALVDGDLTLIESSAIVMHLADKFPEKGLAPALGSDDRARYYRWMVYVPATVDPVLETITMHTRLLPEDKRNPALAEAAKKKLSTIGKVFESALEGKDYIVGGAFSGADVIVGSAAGWMGFIGALSDYPILAGYQKKLAERDAYKRAYTD